MKKYKVEPVFAPDRPEPRPPQEKIEDFIRKSDMFIAIVTKRDKVEGKRNLWKGPAWVQNELAMAYALKKPIAVFVDKAVQLEPSIAPFITDCVRFERRNLASIGKKAESYIEALCNRVQTATSPLVKEKAVDETIVEHVEEEAFKTVITRTGRAILLWRYGKLDVSLRGYYAFAILTTSILSYIGYDSLFGTRTLGPTVASVAFATVIIMVISVSVAESSRCKKCKSYFSKVQRPVTYGDVKKFPDLPKEKILLKYVCEVCGDIVYDTEKREGD